jgi:hypothetical protein
VAYSTVSGKIRLEPLDLLAQDEPTRGQYTVKRRTERVGDRRVLTRQIDECHSGHRYFSPTFAGVRSSAPPDLCAARKPKTCFTGLEASCEKVHELTQHGGARGTAGSVALAAVGRVPIATAR